MSLSRPQEVLLKEIKERPRTVVKSYPPAAKLVKMGLAHWTGKWENILAPTDAGVAVLT